jgi:hypothetical protein
MTPLPDVSPSSIDSTYGSRRERNIFNLKHALTIGSLAVSLLSTGLAASAQSAQSSTAVSTNQTAMMAMGSTGIKAAHRAAQANDDARRVAFRSLGTSL